MRFEGRNDGTGKYYEPIDTCFRCDKCGKVEYVSGYPTLVKENVKDYDSTFENTVDRETGRVVDSKLVSQRYAGSHYIYYDIKIGEDGYRHTYYPYGKKHNWCKKCEKKRRTGTVVILASIIAVILLAVFLNTALVGILRGRGGTGDDI